MKERCGEYTRPSPPARNRAAHAAPGSSFGHFRRDPGGRGGRVQPEDRRRARNLWAVSRPSDATAWIAGSLSRGTVATELPTPHRAAISATFGAILQLQIESIDCRTSMITEEDPLRGLLFYLKFQALTKCH